MKKECSKCKKIKSFSDFHKDSSKKSGLRSSCKECHNTKVKNYKIINPEKVKHSQKKYYDNNRIDILKSKHKNLEENSKRALLYYHAVRKHDSTYRIHSAISTGIYKSLKKLKNNQSWQSIVGYTIEELIERLKPLLKTGMSFENYGSVWHIDHIKPKSKCETIEEAWKLDNLQPLFKIENLRKGNRY